MEMAMDLGKLTYDGVEFPGEVRIGNHTAEILPNTSRGKFGHYVVTFSNEYKALVGFAKGSSDVSIAINPSGNPDGGPSRYVPLNTNRLSPMKVSSRSRNFIGRNRD